MDPLNPNPQAMPLVNSALAWLNAPPAEDPLHELAPLRHHLRAIGGLSPRPTEELALLERFQQRTNIINAALKGLLNDATLPLDPHLRLIAQGLTDIHGLLATAILDAGSKLAEQEASDARLRLAMLGGWVLRNLAEQQEVSLLAACGLPADLWRNAQTAYSLLATCDPAECEAPEQLLKSMFALAAAQPETFARARNRLPDRLPELRSSEGRNSSASSGTAGCLVLARRESQLSADAGGSPASAGCGASCSFSTARHSPTWPPHSLND